MWLDLLTRVAPVLLFLAAVTVLAELAQTAEVFDVLAHAAARAARGRTWLLFVLVCLIASVTTVALSLDTTAVLLTPVVLTMAERLELDPLPFAMATVWLSNTASLLLPVSNLTNLLAMNRLDLAPLDFARRTAPAAAAAVAVTLAVLVAWHRRHLTGRYAVPLRHGPRDKILYARTATCCVVLVGGLVLGLSPAAAAVLALAPAALLFAVRRSADLRLGLVPWRLLVTVVVLFCAVTALGELGTDHLLRSAATTPGRVAVLTAVAANAVNNLPAYLAIERVAPHAALLPALSGANLGPLMLPRGSLATLLWADRCRARGVAVSWRTFCTAGLVLVPLLLLATVPLLS